MYRISELFNELQYKFKMIGKEENEKKFIFSYGIRDAKVNTKDGDLLIGKVQYTLEVSLNILSYDLLEEQGYSVQVNNNMCIIKYMYDEGTSGTKVESNNNLTWGPTDVIK